MTIRRAPTGGRPYTAKKARKRKLPGFFFITLAQVPDNMLKSDMRKKKGVIIPMAIATKIASFTEGASWIRKMFEEGERLRKIHGADNVYDFTLGNPDVEPPPEFSAGSWPLPKTRLPECTAT